MAIKDTAQPTTHDAEHLETQGAAAASPNKPAKANKITFKDILENRRVLLWCIYIFLMPVNFGYEISNVGNLLAVTSFLNRFGETVNGTLLISAKNQQILNAASTVGIFVSAFATGFIADYIGRKYTIMLGCVVCTGGILTQYFAKSVLDLFGGKVVATFGFGLGHSLGPVFVAELAPSKMRGICLVLINTMIVLGQWLNSLVVYACSNRPDDLAWKIPVITQIIPPALLLLGMPFLAESPSWLILKGRHTEAARALRYFNGPKFDVDTALAVATTAVEQERETAQSNVSWLQCFKGSDGRRTLIICMVYIGQQFIGVNFIAGYLTYYYKLAGVNNPIGMAQVAFAVQLLGNIISWFFIERVGRRSMIVGGTTVMTAGLLLIGGISVRDTKPALSATVAFMTVWGFLYQATLGAVAYAVGGETPSVALRQKTYSINIMSATAVSCAVLQVMPYLINTDQANLGGKICFIFFGLSLPVCIYFYFCLPEMAGRSFLEIQEMFDDGIPARQFKGHQCRLTTEMVASVAAKDGGKHEETV